MRLRSGSRKYTDVIWPSAPVLLTGPSSILTFDNWSRLTTASRELVVVKHKSAEPGVGLYAFGSNSLPASWRLIFWEPKVKALRPLSHVITSMPRTFE